ncbi:hypothetical protein CDD83_3062 [Cordyceps sp. RAO-2017]|nr:hypothetical protein CDD83_3062 [Cordyceps sp. RAO-2017]
MVVGRGSTARAGPPITWAGAAARDTAHVSAWPAVKQFGRNGKTRPAHASPIAVPWTATDVRVRGLACARREPPPSLFLRPPRQDVRRRTVLDEAKPPGREPRLPSVDDMAARACPDASSRILRIRRTRRPAASLPLPPACMMPSSSPSAPDRSSRQPHMIIL